MSGYFCMGLQGSKAIHWGIIQKDSLCVWCLNEATRREYRIEANEHAHKTKLREDTNVDQEQKQSAEERGR